MEGSQSIVLLAGSSGGCFQGSPLLKAVLPTLLGLGGGQEGPGGWVSGELGTGRQGRLPWQQRDSLAVSFVDVLAVSVPEEPAARFPLPAGLRCAGPW